jgi:hypothetical protein
VTVGLPRATRARISGSGGAGAALRSARAGHGAGGMRWRGGVGHLKLLRSEVQGGVGSAWRDKKDKRDECMHFVSTLSVF